MHTVSKRVLHHWLLRNFFPFLFYKIFYYLVSFIEVIIVFHAADGEEKKVALIAEEVSKKQQDCEQDLLKAEPALIAAQVRFFIKYSQTFNSLQVLAVAGCFHT